MPIFRVKYRVGFNGLRDPQPITQPKLVELPKYKTNCILSQRVVFFKLGWVVWVG